MPAEALTSKTKTPPPGTLVLVVSLTPPMPPARSWSDDLPSWALAAAGAAVPLAFASASFTATQLGAAVVLTGAALAAWLAAEGHKKSRTEALRWWEARFPTQDACSVRYE